MKTSILVPTRGRPRYVKQLLHTLQDTVSDLNSIELLVAYDRDDDITIRELSGIGTKDFPVKFFSRQRSEWLNKDYYNYLAGEASGDYFFGVGDDVRFLTKDWTALLENKIEAYLTDKEDRIAYISVNEQGSKATHPCFPLITKEAFKVLGEYHCSKLMSWGSDRILWEIYAHPTISRVLSVSEVSIQHLSYHDGTAPFDETARSMKERFFRDPNCHNSVSMYCVPQYRRIIENYIKEFNNARVG